MLWPNKVEKKNQDGMSIYLLKPAQITTQQELSWSLRQSTNVEFVSFLKNASTCPLKRVLDPSHAGAPPYPLGQSFTARLINSCPPLWPYCPTSHAFSGGI